MKKHISLIGSLLICSLAVSGLYGCTARSPAAVPSSASDTSSLILRYEQLLAMQNERIDELLEAMQKKNEIEKTTLGTENEIQNKNPSESNASSNPSGKEPDNTQSSTDPTKERETGRNDTPPTAEELFDYEVTDGTVSITGLKVAVKDLVIPAKLDGKPVVSVADRAFTGTDIQTVRIESGIGSIGWFAFYNCSALTVVSLPDSVEQIGYSAFDGCAKGLVIRCNENSYAARYADSFAIRRERNGC